MYVPGVVNGYDTSGPTMAGVLPNVVHGPVSDLTLWKSVVPANVHVTFSPTLIVAVFGDHG